LDGHQNQFEKFCEGDSRVNDEPKYRQHGASVNPDAALVHSKRALLKAGWMVPVITTISLPKSGYAANISGSARVNSTTQSNRAQPAAGNHYGARRGERYGQRKN
jgi:hypothetical protein